MWPRDGTELRRFCSDPRDIRRESTCTFFALCCSSWTRTQTGVIRACGVDCLTLLSVLSFVFVCACSLASLCRWSVGCILAEMLLGSPLFPGKSTLHQLELVMEVTGRPNKLDMQAIKSKHTVAMLESITTRAQKSWGSILPQAGHDAIDLLSRLLVFNPDRRLSVEDAIRHPYLSQFHNSADEPVLHAPINIRSVLAHCTLHASARVPVNQQPSLKVRAIDDRSPTPDSVGFDCAVGCGLCVCVLCLLCFSVRCGVWVWGWGAEQHR